VRIYNFFDYLHITLDAGSRRGYNKYFDNEYLRINNPRSRSSSAATQIKVSIVNSLPKANSNDIVGTQKYKRLFNYQYLIRNINTDEVLIYFQSHYIDKIYMNAIGVFLQAQILEPIMYMKLLEQNILFMHAGGVCDKENGFLLPAYGGTGKTTFSIALLRHGYKLLGDDLLFVDINRGKVYPYQRPLHLFTYNINNLKGAKVPLKYQIAIYAKNVLRFFLERLLKIEFLISTRVHADEIFKDNPFGNEVKYKGIYFLRKTGDALTDQKITKNNIDKLALEIMKSEDLNDSLYSLLPDNAIKQVKALEVETISKLLSQFKSLTYVNTRKLDLNNLDSFISKELNGKSKLV